VLDRERGVRRVDLDRLAGLAAAQVERQPAPGEPQLNEIGLEARERELGLLAGAHEAARADLELEVRFAGRVELVARRERRVRERGRPVAGARPQERDLALDVAEARRRALEAERLSVRLERLRPRCDQRETAEQRDPTQTLARHEPPPAPRPV
jgi:hypothetical protein